jgi:dTDP-L-rhamnose 4-epimerase
MLLGDFDVYYEGEQVTFELTDENSKLHPSSVYGVTKLTQEMLLMNVCGSLGIESVALRYQNVYGPGQSLSNPYTGILSIFSNILLRGEVINIFEDGKESRDFVYIDDVVQATILAIENPNAANESFNVGSGKRTTVLEVAQALAESFEVKLNYEISGNFRLGDIRHNAADIRKAKNKLGFKTSVSFNDGISRFSKWVLTQQIRKNNFENSLKEMKDKGLLK